MLLRVGSLLRVPVIYVVMVISFSRGEKHAVLSVSLSDLVRRARSDASHFGSKINTEPKVNESVVECPPMSAS